MSRSGQNTDSSAYATAAIRTSWTLSTRASPLHTHVHDAHEFLWGFGGSQTVTTADAAWLLPPAIAMWIPAGIPHAGFVDEGASYYCTRIDPHRFPSPWEEPTPTSLAPAARELLHHLRRAELSPIERTRIEEVVVSLIRPIAEVGVPLPMPVDPRARAVADAVLADPAGRRTVGQTAAAINVSGRTLNRTFVREVGMTFTQWRNRARVHTAILLLNNGHPGNDVARQVGYETSSAFVRAFRQTTGEAPRAYIARVRAAGTTTQ